MKDRFLGILGLGKDQEKPKEVAGGRNIEIGGSNYLLSAEAQKYLEFTGASKYQSLRSVLIIDEPHWILEGQFNLYKGLEVFFRDNPSLISKTTFLAEGFPAGQPIRVEPLIDVEPKPSDEIIWEVLSTFFVSGYLAYAWKYQQNMPIIGIEDQVLYQICSKLVASGQDGEVALWGVGVIARNKSMAKTLIEQSKKCENPILFVGGGHLDKNDTASMAVIKISNYEQSLTEEELEHLKGWENLGVDDYLQRERIGYTLLTPRYIPDTVKEEGRYRNLFRVQQTGSNEKYVAEQVSERIGHTTTRPSPETAAEFLKKYLEARPKNVKARDAASKGLSLTSEGQFIEAAKEFSAACEAEPRNRGYLTLLQDSLLKENIMRVFNVVKDSKSKNYGVDPSIKPDLPVFGPFIRRGHDERVKQFAQRFALVAGSTKVVQNALSRRWESRYAGAFQIEVASKLGPENIKAFNTNGVDIATKGDLAIETITFPDVVAPTSVWTWVKQAAGYKGYKEVVIVIPEGRDLDGIKKEADEFLRWRSPELVGKINIVDLSQIKVGQSGVIFEAKHKELEQTEERQNWVRVDFSEVQTTLHRDTLWSEKGINTRGHDYEKIRLASLGSNCPHIDDWVFNAQTVTSMKSVDLTDKSYQEVRAVDSKVRGYIDDLSGFTEAHWTDREKGLRYDLVRGQEFQDRYIELAIPVGKATQEQIEKLLELQEYAQKKDVTLVIVEVP